MRRQPINYPVSIVDTDDARLPQKNPPSRHIDSGATFKLEKGFSPVMLSSGEVHVTPGAIAVPDHGKLQPVERTAMLVDEIHYNIRADLTLGSNGYTMDPRYALRTQISVGRHFVTGNFVPVAGLEYQYLTNYMTASRALLSTTLENDSLTGCRWKLPVPIYVPAGSVLFSQLQMSSLYYFTSTALVSSLYVDVTYIGRLLPIDYPVPKTVKVPYVSSIQSADVTANPTQTILESKDLQLGNPFDTPMYVQRMIMRQYQIIGFGGLGGLGFLPAYDFGPAIITLRGTFDDVDISIANLQNYYVTFDDGITPATLGTLGHNVLNLYNLELKPKDRFDLRIDNTVESTPDRTFVVASIIGWRNEEI